MEYITYILAWHYTLSEMKHFLKSFPSKSNKKIWFWQILDYTGYFFTMPLKICFMNFLIGFCAPSLNWSIWICYEWLFNLRNKYLISCLVKLQHKRLCKRQWWCSRHSWGRDPQWSGCRGQWREWQRFHSEDYGKGWRGWAPAPWWSLPWPLQQSGPRTEPPQR